MQELLSKFIDDHLANVEEYTADFDSLVKSTWLGGAYLASDRAALKRVQVTRQEYQEHGSHWLGKVFAGSVQR